MEEIMDILKKIQNELNEQKATILQSADKVTEQVTQNINYKLEEKFKVLDDKYENLKEKLEHQEKRLHFLEKQSRQRNIVIFGLAEVETDTSYANLEKTVLSFINQYFSLRLECRDLQETRRIGKKGEHPRPITVTFTSLGTKIEVFKQRTVLKDTAYYIKDDFPKHILEKRKKLQEQLKIEMEKGNFASIKYDKLIIHHKNTDKPRHQKRALPISPNYKDPSQSELKTQVNKKNKTQKGPHRSSSLSEEVIKPGILNFLTAKNQTADNQNNISNKQTNKNTKQ